MRNIVIYQNKKFDLRARENGIYGIFSFDTPTDLFKEIFKSEIKEAYRAQTWVKIRGCNAIFENLDKGQVELNVRPSNDVNILGAKEIDRGIYWAKLPIEEVELVWEERKPYLDFPFPEGYEKNLELDISDLKDIFKRYK
jgi:hypothetical protein